MDNRVRYRDRFSREAWRTTLTNDFLRLLRFFAAIPSCLLMRNYLNKSSLHKMLFRGV